MKGTMMGRFFKLKRFVMNHTRELRALPRQTGRRVFSLPAALLAVTFLVVSLGGCDGLTGDDEPADTP